MRYRLLISLVGALVLVLILGWFQPNTELVSADSGKNVNPASTVGLKESEMPIKENRPYIRKTEHEPSAQNQRPDVQIIGTVSMASTGEPVANAQVTIVATGHWAGYLPAKVRSDQKGHFEINGIKDGHVLVYASKSHLISYAQREDITRLSIDSDVTSVGPIDLLLYPATTMKISVVSKVDNQPLKGATARLLSNPRTLFKDHEDGLLVLPLSLDVWRLQIAAPGHEMEKLSVDLSGGFKGGIEVVLAPAGRF